MSLGSDWREFRARLAVMSAYQRFEQLVTFTLSILLVVIILAAMWNLFLRVLLGLVVKGSLDPTDHAVFQSVFGAIFTVMIALEFKRSIVVSVENRDTVFHVRTVILVALLALLRKFIILDLEKTDAATIAALGFVTVSLGLIYWLIRAQEMGRG
ncbi:phosphate-starvation-inducible PsiE family protein [Thermaurantiacus tibetensis]|uniref:phosphate-starvation-inducible PsiE family protein n=1 Tax=Thermaurantiacus tibetensis TaxID=2759035 RepID=UPI00188E5194|nr:phosphate-starvation-inducible PsiE family protein [Thermaurantiacus tibetensis]